MLTLDFTRQELTVLACMLENCISDLRVEIVGTDNIEYKKMLKQRKKVLKKLLMSVQQCSEQALPAGQQG